MLLILIIGALTLVFLVTTGVVTGWPARLVHRIFSFRFQQPARLSPPNQGSSQGWGLPTEAAAGMIPTSNQGDADNMDQQGARVAFFDCFSGIAGDMALGALVDAGVPLAKIVEGLNSIVGIRGEWKVEAERVHRGIGNIAGTKVHVWSIYDHPHKFDKAAPVRGAAHAQVEVASPAAAEADNIVQEATDADNDTEPEHGHSHGADKHGHSHGADKHSHGADKHSHGADKHGHSHGGGHGHSHGSDEHGGEVQRNMAAIEKLVLASDLPLVVQQNTMKVFGVLAIAEAAAHGCEVSQVHFHEVGAVDSIIDTVGVILGLHLLGVTRVAASALPYSTGAVKCQHGLVPVPAPATLRLMHGIPTFPCSIRGEMVTPTGAAILKAMVAPGDFGTPPMGFTPQLMGSGAGTKEFADRANLVRVVIGTVGAAAPLMPLAARLENLNLEQLFCFEANIDDMNPQLYAPAMQKLFEAGARDVWMTPIVMKKGRPAITISVLCDAQVQGHVVSTMLEHTSTLGVRRTSVDRFSVDRRWETVDTAYGPVKVKLGVRGGELVNAHPEYEDCVQIATTAGVPVHEVFIAAQVAFQAKHVAKSH